MVDRAARLKEGYEAARDDLGWYCDCYSHTLPHYKFSPSTSFCIVDIAQLIIILICMLEHLDLDSPILPTRCGILQLMRLQFVRGRDLTQDSILDRCWITGRWDGHICDRLSTYHCLFSNGRVRPVTCGPDGNLDMCTLSEGAIYCYMDTILNMTDKVEQAYRVHVGAGTINRGSQIHNYILGWRLGQSSNHPAERFGFDDSNAELFGDTTSPSLRMEPVVTEGINISFSYELFTDKCGAQVSPNNLADLLFEASRHRVSMRPNGNRHTSFPLIEHKQLRVVGEGRYQNADHDDDTFNIMLRPHHGNLLGRVVTLIHNEMDLSRWRSIDFLVDDKEDLARATLDQLYGAGSSEPAC